MMKKIRISELEQVPFKGDMIDNCFYVVEPYAPIKAVPLRSVFDAIIEKAKEEGLTVELQSDRIAFISNKKPMTTIEKELEEIVEDTYYEIAGYMAEGTDCDDANEVKKSIEQAMIKAVNLFKQTQK